MKRSAIAAVPGRLDFMGGVADYSGSLVLQLPIRAMTRVGVSRIGEKLLRLGSDGHGAWATPSAPFCALLDSAADEAEARGFLQDREAPPCWSMRFGFSLF